MSNCVETLSGRRLTCCSDLLRPSLVYQGNARKYNRLESELRTLISSCRLLISIQRKEVSLLPRPIKLYAEVIDAADRLVETLGEIRLLRFSVPRQTAVFDVMPLRRELVGSSQSARIMTDCTDLGDIDQPLGVEPMFPVEEPSSAVPAVSQSPTGGYHGVYGRTCSIQSSVTWRRRRRRGFGGSGSAGHSVRHGGERSIGRSVYDS